MKRTPLLLLALVGVALLMIAAAPPSGNFIWKNFWTTNDNPRLIGAGGTTISSNPVTGAYTITSSSSGGSDQVWTNDGLLIHPIVGPTNDIAFARTNGAILIGQNTLSLYGVPTAGEFLISRRDTSLGDNNIGRLNVRVQDGSANYGDFDFGVRTNLTTLDLSRQSDAGGTFDEILLGIFGSDTLLELYPSGNSRTRLRPTALDDGTVPYIFDTSLAKTSGDLFEVKNNGTTKFLVDYNGLIEAGDALFSGTIASKFGNWYITANGEAAFSANLLVIGLDGDLDKIKGVPYSWPSANAVGFFYNDGAGNLSWSTLPFTNLSSYPDHISLTNGANNIKTISASGARDQGTNVDIRAISAGLTNNAIAGTNMTAIEFTNSATVTWAANSNSNGRLTYTATATSSGGGSSGITASTNAFQGTVGSGSNIVFLATSNTVVRGTNTPSNGGTNTLEYDTIQPITTTASPAFANLNIAGALNAQTLRTTNSASLNGTATTTPLTITGAASATTDLLTILSNTVTRARFDSNGWLVIYTANTNAAPQDGITLANTNGTGAGVQAYSPSVDWIGNGWKTTATASNMPVAFRAYVKPVQGAAAPTAQWMLDSSINNAAFANGLSVDSAGSGIFVGNLTANASIYGGSSGSSLAVGLTGNVRWGDLGNATAVRLSASGAGLKLEGQDGLFHTTNNLTIGGQFTGTNAVNGGWQQNAGAETNKSTVAFELGTTNSIIITDTNGSTKTRLYTQSGTLYSSASPAQRTISDDEWSVLSGKTITTNIDGTATGNTTLYTVPENRQLIVERVIIIPTTVTTLVTPPTVSVGKTASAYIDVAAAIGLTGLTTVNTSMMLSPITGATVLQASDNLVLRVSVGANASAYTFKAIVIGILL